MKNASFTIAVASLLFIGQAIAGVNGTYKVSGKEIDHGRTYAFTGTIKVVNYTKGSYNLKFSDGDKAVYSFKFVKKPKDQKKAQTVTAKNSSGTSTVTFQTKKGKETVKFTYQSKDGSILGKGSGAK